MIKHTGRHMIFEATKEEFDLKSTRKQLVKLNSPEELFTLLDKKAKESYPSPQSNFFCLGNVCSNYWHVDNFARRMLNKNRMLYLIYRNKSTLKYSVLYASKSNERQFAKFYDKHDFVGIYFQPSSPKPKSPKLEDRRKIISIMEAL